MRITAKILVPNLLSLALLGGALVLIQLQQDRALLERSAANVSDTNRVAAELNMLNRRTVEGLLSYRYEKVARHLRELRYTQAQLERTVAEFRHWVATPRGRELLDEFMRSRQGIVQIQDELIDAINRANEDDIQRAYMRWSLKNEQVQANLDDLVTYKAGFYNRTLEEVSRRRAYLIFTVTLLATFAFGAIVASSIYYGRSIATPLTQLTEVSDRIARGDTAGRVGESQRNDELGRLSRAFNRMASQVLHAKANLERQVEERTAELARANESLREEMTERLRIQEALLQSERLAAIGQMVTGLSHESRNALQRSLACLEMLRRRVSNDPRLAFLLEEASKAQADLQQVYEGVRNYAGPITLDCVTRDLAAIWRGAWDDLQLERKDRRVEFHECIQVEDLCCAVDSFRLAQVFRNLFENALAACPDPVAIEIHCSDAVLHHRPAVRVVVRDNGPGIDEEQLPRIFEPFFTTKTKGTGLGLAIVKRIMDAHKSEVEVHRQDGRGRDVILVIPREAPG